MKNKKISHHSFLLLHNCPPIAAAGRLTTTKVREILYHYQTSIYVQKFVHGIKIEKFISRTKLLLFAFSLQGKS